MTELLALLLRIAGAGLILLALLHIPIGKQLRWKEDCKQLTPVNETVFHVHTFFICIVLVMMGLPCLLQPAIFLTPTPAGAWLTWAFAAFWFIRLYCQWFVYRADLWRGQRMETAVHWWFTFIWTALTALFAACGAVQVGWLQ
jgi:hypothetical protein